MDDRQRSSDRNSVVYFRAVRNSEKLSSFWMSVSSNFGPYSININTYKWVVPRSGAHPETEMCQSAVLHVMCISEPKASMLWKLAAPFGS